MGRPRYTSLAEQNVWMEKRIAELEADNKRLAKYAKGWHDGHKVGMERAVAIAFSISHWHILSADGLAEAIRKEIDNEQHN
jgi:hypothetical protein